MQKLERSSTKVLVLSSQKGCFVTAQLLKNSGHVFSFGNKQKEIKQQDFHFVIVDKAQNIEKLKSFSGSHRIVLKDTQKSPASILALSGQLSTFGQDQKEQFVPWYMLDFVVGIGLAIYILQVKNSSIPTTKDAIEISLIDLAHYYGAFNISAKQNGFLKNRLGKNLLDGGAPFYSIYECKEGSLAVGNLEPKFYQEMIKGLDLDEQRKQFLKKNQFNIEKWGQMRKILKDVFALKPASDWQKIMSSHDTCITQVSQRPRHEFKIQPKIYTLTKPKL